MSLRQGSVHAWCEAVQSQCPATWGSGVRRAGESIALISCAALTDGRWNWCNCSPKSGHLFSVRPPHGALSKPGAGDLVVLFRQGALMGDQQIAPRQPAPVRIALEIPAGADGKPRSDDSPELTLLRDPPEMIAVGRQLAAGSVTADPGLDDGRIPSLRRISPIDQQIDAHSSHSGFLRSRDDLANACASSATRPTSRSPS